jgi:hypothetical protein
MAKIEKPVLKKQDGRKSNGGARPDAGRPAFEPTDSERKQVEAMSGYGLPIEQIAVLVRDGIHVDTLRAHFATELVSGKAKANSGVGRTLFQKAMGGDTAAMIWWSKTQMRWKEVQHHELTGKDGGPIETVSLDVGRLSTDVLAQIMAAKTGGSDE